MPNLKQEEEFNRMINAGIEDLSHEQSDERTIDYLELKEQQFNEMMQEQVEVERGGPYLETDPGAEIMTPTDANVSSAWFRPKEAQERAVESRLRKSEKEIQILECTLQTDEYLGYLRGAEILAKLDGKMLHAGFYKAKYDKFVKDNTP